MQLANNQYNELLIRLQNVRKFGDLNGTTAKKAENLHRLFLYPAMMVPITQSLIIEALSKALPKNAIAMDPYMGSGTSLMSCMEYGIGIYGQDINPLAVLIVNAKISSYNTLQIKQSYASLIDRIKQDKSSTIDVQFSGVDKWFSRQVQQDLSRLRRCIIAEKIQSIRYLYWVVMSEIIRLDSNDRTSTYKLHQRPIEDIAKREINVIRDFCVLFERCLNDIEDFKQKLSLKKLLNGDTYSKYYQIRWGNSLKKINNDQKFDLLVSSPPYGDNHTTVTYGQHSYLQLQWIDPLDLDCNIDYDYLRTTQEIDRQSLGGKLDSKWINNNLPDILSRIPSLNLFYNSIPEGDRAKYFKTISFIADFEQSLDNIVASMKDNAFYVWTIGNRYVNKREVPNDKILIDLMTNKHIPLIFNAEREILNKKQSKRNRSSQTMEKEHILIFQRQG
jgi:DNA (cytosine-5-)-methyltransferase